MIEKLKNLPIATHSKIQMICWVAGILIGLAGCSLMTDNNVNIGMIIGCALMISGFVWHFLFLRCPYCGHHFHLRQAVPNFCPNCGKQIL